MTGQGGGGGGMNGGGGGSKGESWLFRPKKFSDISFEEAEGAGRPGTG